MYVVFIFIHQYACIQSICTHGMCPSVCMQTCNIYVCRSAGVDYFICADSADFLMVPSCNGGNVERVLTSESVWRCGARFPLLLYTMSIWVFLAFLALHESVIEIRIEQSKSRDVSFRGANKTVESPLKKYNVCIPLVGKFCLTPHQWHCWLLLAIAG